MKYLGIDFGAKRIGLAVSSHGIAFPHDTIQNDDTTFSALKDLIVKERIDHIVVGDTRTIEGRENPITKRAEEFAERLKKESDLPVEFASEADSSMAVAREGEQKRDDSAAAFILQRYLDMKGGTV